MLIKDIANFAQTYPIDAIASRITHIVASAGQSNGYTGGLSTEWPSDTLNPSIDVSGGRVFQLVSTPSGSYATIVSANEPLQHPIPVTTGIGQTLAFLRDGFIPNQIAPRPNILIVPYAVSNTGFLDNRWNPGNDLFAGLCSALGVALRMCPKAELTAIDWMQGEREAGAGWTQLQYATAFDAFLTGLRNELEVEVPIILGSMRPGWVAANAARQAVQDALADTPNRVFRAAYANANSPTAIGTVSGAVHYSASEQRAMGLRRWTAWQTL